MLTAMYMTTTVITPANDARGNIFRGSRTSAMT